MQQQLALGLGLVIGGVAVRVFIDVRVVQPDLVVLHAGESIPNLSLAGAEGFHLSAAQDDARLKRFLDVVLVAGFRIGQDGVH